MGCDGIVFADPAVVRQLPGRGDRALLLQRVKDRIML